MEEIHRFIAAALLLALFIVAYFLAGEFLYDAGGADQLADHGTGVTVSGNE